MLASYLGIFLEFLDFTIYGYSASIIAHNFFPNIENGLDYVWLIFAGGFLFRLLGAIFFGYLGDTKGVKFTLTCSITLMALATTLIGCLPTYEQIGIISPILLLVLRCLQGFAVSPEYSGVAVYLNKNKIYENNYSFLSSISVSMAGFGMLSGGSIIAFLTKGFNVNDIPQWRWRLPFIASGLILGIIIFWLRISMKEKNEKPNKFSILQIIKKQKNQLILATLTVGLIGIITYTLNGYLSIFLRTIRGYDLDNSIKMSSSQAMLLCFAIPISGWLCDLTGREKIIKISLFFIAICSPFIFYLISYGSSISVKTGIVLLSILLGFISGAIPSFLAKEFTVDKSYSGSSFAYNFGMSCFGSITPWLMLKASNYNYIFPGFIISIFALYLLFLFYKKQNKAVYNSHMIL